MDYKQTRPLSQSLRALVQTSQENEPGWWVVWSLKEATIRTVQTSGWHPCNFKLSQKSVSGDLWAHVPIAWFLQYVDPGIRETFPLDSLCWSVGTLTLVASARADGHAHFFVEFPTSLRSNRRPDFTLLPPGVAELMAGKRWPTVTVNLNSANEKAELRCAAALVKPLKAIMPIVHAHPPKVWGLTVLSEFKTAIQYAEARLARAQEAVAAIQKAADIAQRRMTPKIKQVLQSARIAQRQALRQQALWNELTDTEKDVVRSVWVKDYVSAPTTDFLER